MNAGPGSSSTTVGNGCAVTDADMTSNLKGGRVA